MAANDVCVFVCVGVPQDLKEAQTKKKVTSENGFWSFKTQSSDGFQQTWNYLQKIPQVPSIIFTFICSKWYNA